MPGGEDTIRSLREALKASPDNVPLMKHLAETLAGLGRLEEAEKEFRQALQIAPADTGLKVGLARVFYQLGKDSAAIVIVEELLQRDEIPPPALVLHARLLLRNNEADRAARQYCRAIEEDPAVADPVLAGQLGVEEEDKRVRVPVEEGEEGTSIELENPKSSFKDVGGMEELKEEIRLKIIHPLNHPELYAAYGKKVGGGILMYGPPGCGKTHLARATAGEIKAKFLAVGISDVLDMYLGQSEQNLHAIFEEARANTPCVLFFDEVDALGASRTDMKKSAGRQLINQFLSELDGVKSTNDGVLILAATNAPWHLDSAFRRPGRFDRVLFVPPPDETARGEILRILIQGKPLEDIDFPHLGKKLKDFSGADLRNVIEIAVEEKLREAMKEGVPKPITTKDLLTSSKKVRPSTKEWFSTARNYALYSNEGGLYDEILKYLKL